MQAAGTTQGNLEELCKEGHGELDTEEDSALDTEEWKKATISQPQHKGFETFVTNTYVTLL